MGYRLSKIYTKTGDKGETGMADGSRVAKDDIKVAAIGDVDELNSQIGLLAVETVNLALKDQLNRIQHILFDLGAELTLPAYQAIEAAHVTSLENYLDQLNEKLAPLDEFILPGGSRTAALAHISRAVCRRVERSLVSLNKVQALNSQALAFINRLSDLLFVIARQACVDDGVAEIYWQKGRTQT
ncbi:MAG: cob(I)yrinic acid a,c-diamide adenosyltransferase [Gammaproteobacteria bacterium]|nr:cob(I)yrinic acid a,c-diamide adenosyltransferase [Gammaproteobacteria bacterium]